MLLMSEGAVAAHPWVAALLLCTLDTRFAGLP